MLNKIKIWLVAGITSPIFGLFAQTGPGGVGNSGTNVLWLKADAITGYNHGEAITTWDDASGNSNSASQSTVAYRPTYRTGEINGKPVIRFDGINDYLDDNHSYNARTIFSVFRIATSLQRSTDLGQLWGSYGEATHIAMDARRPDSNRYL